MNALKFKLLHDDAGQQNTLDCTRESECTIH